MKKLAFLSMTALVSALHAAAIIAPGDIPATEALSPSDTTAILRTAVAQSDDDAGSYQMQFLPSVIPPTPQAAALARYGEYPVSHTTGIPDITIPLYEIDLGGYKLPISISYHASGFRPDDVATPVGLGWVLNAGGAVTRTIMGAPDFYNQVVNDTIYRDFNAIDSHLKQLSQHGGDINSILLTAAGGMEAPYDTESDRYTYNIPGKSGVFRYAHESHEWISLNASNLKISKNPEGFGISDSEADYTFSVEEQTGYDPRGEGNPVPTSWYMSSIFTPYGEISFEYEWKPSYTTGHISQMVYVMEAIYQPNEDRGMKYTIENPHSETALYYFDQMLLKTILWRAGSISFSYDCDGQDIGTFRLTEMKVMTPDKSVIKTVKFKSSYWGSSKYKNRRMLDAIEDSEQGKFSFSYNRILDSSLPDYRSLSQGQLDYWGYFKKPGGKSWDITKRALSMILPKDIYNPDKYFRDASDKDPSFIYTSLGILTSINYPTGGKTIFKYELNDHGGGLRIAEMNSSGNDANRKISYSYSAGYRIQPDPDEAMTYAAWCRQYGNAIGVGHFSIRNVAMAMPMFSPYWGAGVFYGSVTETYGDGSGKTYSYSPGIVANDPIITDNDILLHPYFYPPALVDEGGVTPLLKTVTTRDSTGGNVLTEEYEYQYINHRVFNTGVRLVSLLTEIDCSRMEDCTGSRYCTQTCYMPREKTSAIAKAFNRVKKTVTDHVTGVVTEQTYTYDPQLRTLKPRSVAFTGSDGSRDSTRYEFPFDRSDSFHTGMAQRYPDAILSVRTYRGGTLASTVTTGYDQWYYPEVISTTYGDGKLQERERVLSRGAGNRPTAILVNTVDTTRIEWDSRGLYPLKVTAPGGMTTRYEWKPLTGITMVTDPRDYKVAYGYDTSGRLAFIRDARDTLQTFAYSIINGPYGSQTANSVTTMRHINASGNRVMTRQYHDKFGRPTALAQGGLNTSGTYVYTFQTYDSNGRIADTWLPVGGTSTISNPSEYAISLWARSTYSDTHAFSTTTYDGAGRPVRATTPGALWHSAGKGRDIVRVTNAANSVRRYSAPVTGTSLVKEGFYAPGTLHGETTVDEDGNSLTVFTDKSGRKVLERRGRNNDTYFVYNIYGQLRFVLSPEYQSAGYKEKYAYEYRYDERGNVVKKFIPGCGYTQYWYDRADRLTFMQDPLLREAGLYRFFLYDRAGRLALQGTCTACDRSGTTNPVTYTHGAAGVGSTGYVMTDASRITSPVIESVTYHDSYSLPAGFTPLKLATPPATITTGLVTAAMSVASDGTQLRSVSYYDAFGRLIEQRSTGMRGQIAVTTTSYSYTDKPVKTRFKEGDVTVTTEYTYDPATDLLTGRRVYTNIGKGDYSALVASYAYDALGRVASVTLGNSAGAIDYTRDLHGRLQSVTHPAFAQRLFYADGPGTPLYNGSISAMMWKTPEWYRWRGYRYTYNNLGWLTKAQYGENESLTTDRDHYTVTYGDFTANGSIRRLQRHGRKDDGIYGKIDNLNLRYDGNRLVSVEEDADRVTREGSNDFHPSSGSTAIISYNSWGAPVSDTGRGIVSVTYDNSLMPRSIKKRSGNSIAYTYSCDGRRLRTIHSTISGYHLVYPERPDSAVFMIPGDKPSPIYEKLFRRDTLDYSGPVVYENGAVKRVMFDGGYATFSDAGVPNWHYYVCDHAGSVRTVVDMWGRPEQTNHYYPYGLTFADAGKGSSLQPYKFGSKELDAMYGLNIYDFHARTQTPDLARFTRPDPLAEKTPHLSPYLFCANDPVNNTDPTGMIVEYLGADPEREDMVKSDIHTLCNDSKTFKEIYDCLESLPDVITVGFGITSDIGNDEKAKGEYRVDEKAIVFDVSNENPTYSVISEEFYHAYQEANKYLNLSEWNREFEAKVATSVICSEAQKGLSLFQNMEKFSLEVFLDRPDASSMSFESKYKLYGNKFADSYKHIPNYNVPVNKVPNTLKYLLRK